MWNKFWFCKIRMGYFCHVLCFMSVSYFSSLTETRDVWPSEWHSQLWRAGQLPPWDGDRHHIYCPVYPGTHYLVSYNQNIQISETNAICIYPDFVDKDPDLLLLQPADLLKPLLLELIWLEDLDIGHRGPEDAALVVLDVLGQLVIPANGKCLFGF